MIKNDKQIVLWSHPRSGSTYLTTLINVYFIERFKINLETDDESQYSNHFMPIWDSEVKVYRDEIFTANLLKRFYDFNERDIYSVWKIMTTYYKNNKPKLTVDYDTVYRTTNSFSIGRKNWKHTVISFLKSKQTGVWNTTEKTEIKEFDYKNVKIKDIFAICHMIAFWYITTKKFGVPLIWYEELTFTQNDLHIFGLGYDDIELDPNLFTKKVTKQNEYELFDEIIKHKNISLEQIIKRTKLPVDKENINLLRDM